VTAPERDLALLLCGTRARREACGRHILELLQRIDASQFIRLLDELRLASLVGRRLLALDAELDPWLSAQLRARMERSDRDGAGHELITLAVLASLEQAGIRALGLKGSVLARQLYDDPGARPTADIDILVAADDLPGAVETVQRMGWRHNPHLSRSTRLPILHETLSRDGMPRVEMHWRVHWYETRFAADALGRAERSGPHQPLVMSPSDGLAALLLFYARDGFYGLRLAADVATWWDRMCAEADPDPLVGGVADAYPALAAPLQVAGAVLNQLVGLPVTAAPTTARRRLAAALATPFPGPDLPQVLANASLVDLLLSPRGQWDEAVGRELQKIPEDLERRLRPRDGLQAYLHRSEHGLRVLRRWAMALAPALSALR
jgi:hypothetical protein